MQIFIQTDGKIIDVSKITHLDIGHKARVVVHFAGGTQTQLKRAEAELLLEAMHGLSRGPQRLMMAINTAQSHTGGMR